jgi:putative spermidine/putrescine transport system permease protein/spermidine/putrescine transport system permease protein
MSVAAGLDEARAAAGPNAAGLQRDESAERRMLLLLCTPGMLVALVLLFLPIGWLFWFSIVDGAGAFTAENYVRIWRGGAYLAIFATTFEISLLVTTICLLLGYPLAYCLSQLSPRLAGILLLGVLVPFWTSLLVRTYAWLVLLQRQGLVNNLLINLGVIDQPAILVHNTLGVVIGMTHIMLPFLVLPLYVSMRAINTDYMKAAASLGGRPAAAFWTVFFPLSMPGLVAGVVLTFILCLGFYITPAILGGGRVQFIAQRIYASVSLFPTWGPASALGVVLLVLTVAVLLLSQALLKRWRRRFG